MSNIWWIFCCCRKTWHIHGAKCYLDIIDYQYIRTSYMILSWAEMYFKLFPVFMRDQQYIYVRIYFYFFIIISYWCIEFGFVVRWAAEFLIQTQMVVYHRIHHKYLNGTRFHWKFMARSESVLLLLWHHKHMQQMLGILNWYGYVILWWTFVY